MPLIDVAYQFHLTMSSWYSIFIHFLWLRIYESTLRRENHSINDKLPHPSFCRSLVIKGWYLASEMWFSRTASATVTHFSPLPSPLNWKLNAQINYNIMPMSGDVNITDVLFLLQKYTSVNPESVNEDTSVWPLNFLSYKVGI